jgi:hypothetical protein
MKERINLIPILFFLLLITSTTSSAQENINNTNEDIKNFYELVGTWDCKGLSRNQDGTWQTDTTHSTWVWFELFEGNAIQDIFYGGVNHTQIDTASNGGTNIRIYNDNEKQWNMAWFDTNNRTIEVFTAVGDNEKIVMDGINAKGRHIQNHFTEISDSFFLWTQYWTFDEGKSWIDVAKIWCTKVNM